MSDGYGVRRDFVSEDLTLENLPTRDGALILGSSLEGNPAHHGFRLVNGEWRGIVHPRVWSPAEVVASAKQSRYDVIIDGV